MPYYQDKYGGIREGKPPKPRNKGRKRRDRGDRLVEVFGLKVRARLSSRIFDCLCDAGCQGAEGQGLSPQEIADRLTLETLLRHRGIGFTAIADITRALKEAGAKPNWEWPQPKHYRLSRCPHCGKPLKF
jgi:hypothetical protein